MAPAQIMTAAQRAFVEAHRVARLATAGQDGRPHVVPICYAFDGRHVYSAIDEKPKRVPPASLRRLRNIESNPQVAVIVDDYSDDWTQLAYVLLQGAARILTPGREHQRALRLLREKYPQYRAMALESRPVLRITPVRVSAWGKVG